MLSSAAGLMEIRAQAERDSGIGLKLFGFIAESVFTFIPESCSRSPRNSVRNHPGIAFTFPRIPQFENSRPPKLANARAVALARATLGGSRLWRVSCRTESNKSSLVARPSSSAQVEKSCTTTATGLLLKG